MKVAQSPGPRLSKFSVFWFPVLLALKIVGHQVSSHDDVACCWIHVITFPDHAVFIDCSWQLYYLECIMSRNATYMRQEKTCVWNWTNKAWCAMQYIISCIMELWLSKGGEGCCQMSIIMESIVSVLGCPSHIHATCPNCHSSAACQQVWLLHWITWQALNIQQIYIESMSQSRILHHFQFTYFMFLLLTEDGLLLGFEYREWLECWEGCEGVQVHVPGCSSSPWCTEEHGEFASQLAYNSSPAQYCLYSSPVVIIWHKDIQWPG